MTRPRTLLATLLLLAAVLWGAAIAGAQADRDAPAAPATPTTPTSLTVTVSVPPTSVGELPRTGPDRETTGLGVFGFVLIGVGVVALAGSRQLLTSERVRR